MIIRETEFLKLEDINTVDEELAVYVFKRMIDQMHGQTVSSVRWGALNKIMQNTTRNTKIRYQYPGVDVQETEMIVDGKPFVIRSYTVKDSNEYDIMTVYVAGKDGYKPISKISFQSLLIKERNKQNLLNSGHLVADKIN